MPDNKRGFYTSFIQITASLGFFISILVVLGTQSAMTKEQLGDWGWRMPFLLSIILVSVSHYIRLKMRESPIFSQIKSSGMTSAMPVKEAFTEWPNLKCVLISLFGATVGQGVIWYTGPFYALFYLQTVLKINTMTGYAIVAIASLLAMPFFTLFGSLSYRFKRKWIMMAACLLSIASYIPIYMQMQQAAGKNVVTRKPATEKVTGAIKLTAMTLDDSRQRVPAKEAPNPNLPQLVFLVFIQVIFVCMIYGPIAAYFVEAFPARIRYTSLSLPYHIANGVFGGLLPLIGLTLCARTGNIYAGLYYPMIVAAITVVIGNLLLSETHGTLIWNEYSHAKKS